MPSFAALAARLRAASSALRGDLREFGAFEGYPQLVLTFGTPHGPWMFIDAGIHGEEPASTLGLATWLESSGATWAQRIGFTVLPCLNPHGFEQGTRGSRDLDDLNRHFDEPGFPLAKLVVAAVGGRTFDLAMDLHEDCDFTDLYLYELKGGPPFLGERLIGRAAERVPISHGEDVGPFRTQHGLLRPGGDEDRMRTRTGWPIAFLLRARAAKHVVTPETPGKQPLDVRIAVHREGLDTACAFLLERPAPPTGGEARPGSRAPSVSRPPPPGPSGTSS